jgi:hypothetical protein
MYQNACHKIFVTISSPGPNVITIFTAVTYECSYEVLVFVTGRPFQPCLMFAVKAKSLLERYFS